MTIIHIPIEFKTSVLISEVPILKFVLFYISILHISSNLHPKPNNIVEKLHKSDASDLADWKWGVATELIMREKPKITRIRTELVVA